MSGRGDIDKMFLEIDSSLRRYKQEFAVEFLERVRQRTPVLTGALQGGWGFDMHVHDVTVYNTKDYAGYVENGTKFMRPVGMLKTTMLEAQQISDIAKKKAGVK